MRYISLCCVTPASFENVKEYGFLYSSCGATYMLNTPIEVPIFLKWVRSWIYKEEWRYYEKRKCVPPFVWESCILMFFFFSHILLLTKDMSCNSMAHLDVLGEIPTFSNQPGSIHIYMSENHIWDFQKSLLVSVFSICQSQRKLRRQFCLGILTTGSTFSNWTQSSSTKEMQLLH